VIGGPTRTWDSAYAEATLPAKDLDRAKTFYSDRLGLNPISEDRVGVHFVMGGTRFRLFRSGGTASGAHTQLAFVVGDLIGLLDDLKSRGLEFENYDYPNLKTVDGIADLGYARAAWFKDSEGNLLGIAQLSTDGS
jgi:catechol-2,3-dioxygenase